MIADRYIETFMAGQGRVTELIAAATAHDDELAHQGDEMRDAQKYEVQR